MSFFINPLATTAQLEGRYSSTRLSANAADHPSAEVPQDLQDQIRFSTARLTQAAGVLLRLPQQVAAQAVVVLMRFWVGEGVDLMGWEFGDVSAASIYLTAKLSSSPRSLRSITNVYAYLLSSSSPLSRLSSHHRSPQHPTSKNNNHNSTDRNNSHDASESKNDPESYYLSESAYIASRTRILNLEGQILNVLGFNTHVALPHPLAITYLQALEIFSLSSSSTEEDDISSSSLTPGQNLSRRVIHHLNTALLSPQLPYLTHQPNALAVAAIYLAAREEGIALPESEWWEVFDVEREEVGFLVVVMGSLEGWVEKVERMGRGTREVLRRRDVERLVSEEEKTRREIQSQVEKAIDGVQ